MDNFEEKRSVLVNKYTNAPETVSKKDLSSYESFYALKTYFWNNQEKTKVVLGDYEVTHTFRRGISSNSGKSKSHTQHKFIIKSLINDEQWEDGVIIKEHNRRSRFGSVEKYNREMGYSEEVDYTYLQNLSKQAKKKAVKGSILEFAKGLHLPIGLLLDELAKAKVNITNEDDLITPEDKDRLLNFLMSNYQKKEKARLR